MTLSWIGGRLKPIDLGTIQERRSFKYEFQTQTDQDTVNFSVIAGQLPRGLRIEGDAIVGVPVEVRVFTSSKFVVRANDGKNIKDQTFVVSVDGADKPEWITNEGFLPVGRGNAFFVLDNSQVNFQLNAFDSDVIAGDVLEYYLVPNGGELPPGLTLSRNGLISGFTDPIFSVEYTVDRRGGYDVNPYDTVPKDFQTRNTTGFDTFLYDNFVYDYTESNILPRRLSRIYTFVIAVTDGLHTENRSFKIYVVPEEFLRSDNTIVQVGTGVFTADSSGDREPIWITGSDLGKFRANNHVTIYIEIYNPPTLPGSVSYILLPKNPDDSDSMLPSGLELDPTVGILSGEVPYQSKVTVTYRFTLLGIYFPARQPVPSLNFRGDWLATTVYSAGDSVRFQGFIYIALTSNNIGNFPTDGEFWNRTVSTSERTFTVDVFGELESGVVWISDQDLGTIKPNLSSMLFVQAESALNIQAESVIFDINNFRLFTQSQDITGFYNFINQRILRKTVQKELPRNQNNRIFYTFVEGKLPPGLTLLNSGLIQGKVKQFGDDAGNGLTRFYEVGADSVQQFNVSFDQKSTTFDRKFLFTVRARDGFRFAERERTFSITVTDIFELTFANLWVKAFQTKQKRLEWYDFITNSEIFVPELIYRIGDTNFGVQTEIKALMYAGIESVDAVKYVQAMSRNHYHKQLRFGDLKTAKAKDPATQETIYEVIYVNIVDELETQDRVSISQEVKLPRKINSPVLISYDSIDVSSNIPLASDGDHQRVFPNSIKNMRSQINQIGQREREFLPLWMRSIQDTASFETGFVAAVILCYAKPGFSKELISRIQASKFNFQSINFDIDRYVIDVIDGNFVDKYLAFPQQREKLP